jgi:hypothetical protein
LLAVSAAAFGDVLSATGPCRAEFVVPYGDQCTFAYHGIKKDRSPASLRGAYGACDQAQTAALACISSPTRQIHVVALGALYTAVTAQSEIAMFAGQYRVAEALLREKLNVLDAIGKVAKPGDAGLADARAATEADIADALAGICTFKALSVAGRQQTLLRTHAFGELAKLLLAKWADYEGCSRLAATPQHRAYVEYLGYVALEEGGRAAQASGDAAHADRAYRTCIAGTGQAAAAAAPAVRGYLKNVKALCRGRLTRQLGVNQPQPIDADDGSRFRPVGGAGS